MISGVKVFLCIRSTFHQAVMRKEGCSRWGTRDLCTRVPFYITKTPFWGRRFRSYPLFSSPLDCSGDDFMAVGLANHPLSLCKIKKDEMCLFFLACPFSEIDEQ